MRLNVIFFALLISLNPVAVPGQPVRPLTLEGKTALYQRVIAVPGAELLSTPDDPAGGVEAVDPFTVFYVYDRQIYNDQEWLQVSTSNNGRIDGWLAAVQGIDWKQTLTVSFKDPSMQQRVLLFEDRDPLKQLAGRHDTSTYQALWQQAASGTNMDSPVIAMQPEGYINIRRNFYLVPILSHEDILIGAHQGRLLQVATVPLRDPTALSESYRAGIVFVIDTTISMGPYIDITRSTMQRVYQSIEESQLTNRVSFGLVAYRDNTTAVPGLDYTSRLYVNLADGVSGDVFESGIRNVQPATISSRGFNEDAYAGIKQAIDDIEWQDFDARYIILITDAGPRISGDLLSDSGLDTESLRRLAHDNGIALMVMHLRTPEGTANHAYASDHYRRMSHINDIGDLYYPVETGDVNSYEYALGAMTEQLTSQVGVTDQRLASKVMEAARPDTATESGSFQNKVEKLGYALRMRYLKSDTQHVPQLFNAWMIDRDFEDPGKQSVDVRVLLTRDQLSDLYEVLRQVLGTAEQGTLAPQDFLDELKSLSVTISRDPEAAKSATRTVSGASLADLGYMREYIEGLPYQSEVMDLDLSTWQQWSAQRQFEFINQLDGKIAYYRALHNNVDLWVSLDDGPVDGDSVYPLLLEALP
jgi:hypothetical protein